MAIRYYPSSRVKTNLITKGGEFFLEDKAYVGKYYETFDGKYYTGPNPVLGKNEELKRIVSYPNNPGITKLPTLALREAFAKKTSAYAITANAVKVSQSPTSYQPKPTQADYNKGYFTRYFVKRINDKGYIIEISPDEYAAIQDGTVPYDVSFWLTAELFWKISGAMRTVRLSQWDIRMGILDLNQSNTEKLEKTFLGIKDFIGGEYTKFAVATQ